MIESVSDQPHAILRSVSPTPLPSQIKFPANPGALYPLLKELKSEDAVEGAVALAAPELMSVPDIRQLLLQTAHTFKSQIDYSTALEAQIADISAISDRTHKADKMENAKLREKISRLTEENRLLQEEVSVLGGEGVKIGDAGDLYQRYKELKRHARDLTAEQAMQHLAPDATPEALRAMLMAALAGRYRVEGQSGLTNRDTSSSGFAKRQKRQKERTRWETRRRLAMDSRSVDLRNSEDVDTGHAAEVERLTKQLTLDPLTGLLNKVAFEDELEITTRSRLGRQDCNTAFSIFFDLNDFKFFNFIFGQPRGDEMLKHVADVIKTTAEASATDVIVGRIGGDEFGVLILDRRKGEPALVDANALAANIKQALVDKPYEAEYPLAELSKTLRSHYQLADTELTDSIRHLADAQSEKQRTDAERAIAKNKAIKASIEVVEREIAEKIAASGLDPSTCDEKHVIRLKGKFLLRLGAGVGEIHHEEKISAVQHQADENAQKDKTAMKGELGSKPLMEITGVRMALRETEEPAPTWAGGLAAEIKDPRKRRALTGDSLGDIRLPSSSPNI